MKRVLILDANQRSALSATRSLGKRNIPVTTADTTPSALAGSSTYSENYLTYPSPQKNPHEFINTLLDIVKIHNIELIFPMTELTTMLVLERKAEFVGVSLPFPALATIDSLADKCELMTLAKSVDVPVPAFWRVDDINDLPFEPEKLDFPVVLKPGKSWLQNNGEWFRSNVRICNNSLILNDIINNDPACKAHPFMLQEYISGSGQGVFAVYDHGQPVAFFSHRRLREKPPSGGVSVLSESVETDATLLRHAKALLDAVHWHGIAMVEYKVSDDGSPYLMEINTRFWGSLQLAIDAGVDFPWILYQIACGDRPTPVSSYQSGHRLRWLLGDLDSLYLLFKDKNRPSLEKMKALIGFFIPSLSKTRHEVNRWDDMGPFWWELRHYIRQLIH